ncbi:MAG: hypothetical protein LIP28_09000, partial [Deltaproteobacteria bacterium]|nr:hypothetical protein [Deltaproteobacteria bacterium]
SPPSPPEGRVTNLFETIASLQKVMNLSPPIASLALEHIRPHDRFTFYCLHDDKDRSHQEYHAQELRHETHRSFSIAITPKTTDKLCKGLISCKVSAKNVKKSVSASFKLAIDFQQGNTKSKADSIIAGLTADWLNGGGTE